MPDGIRASVDSAIDPLRSQLPELRWVRPESWHLTLKFLGSVEDERIQPVMAMCEEVAANVAKGWVHLEGLDGFPSLSRPRVLVIRVADHSGVAAGLAGSLEERFSALGFPGEERAFRPHLTLARVARRGPLKGLPEGGLSYDRSPFLVAEAVLFLSRPGPGGSVYEAIGRFPLA